MKRGRERALKSQERVKRFLNYNTQQLTTPEKLKEDLKTPTNVFDKLSQDARRRNDQRRISEKENKTVNVSRERSKASNKSVTRSNSVSAKITNQRSSAVLVSRFLHEFDKLLLDFSEQSGLIYFDEFTEQMKGERESISKFELKNFIKDHLHLDEFK